MAKDAKKGRGVVERAAEGIGHALGTVVGTIESVQVQHPNPVEEARDALAAGQEKLAAVTSGASARATSVIESAKAVVTTAKKAAVRARKKSGPTKRAKARAAVRRGVKRAAKAIKRGRKNVASAVRRRKR